MTKAYLTGSSDVDYVSPMSDSEDEKAIPYSVPYGSTLFARDVHLTSDNFYSIHSTFSLERYLSRLAQNKKKRTEAFPKNEKGRADWTKAERLAALRGKRPDSVEEFAQAVSPSLRIISVTH